MMTTHTMTKAKEARYCAVNLDVWVKKPGPMADVAIRKAAPNSTDMLGLTAGWLGFVLLISTSN